MKKRQRTLLFLLTVILIGILAPGVRAQDLSTPPFPEGFSAASLGEPGPRIETSQDLDPDISVSGNDGRDGISFYSGSGSYSDIDEADGSEDEGSSSSSGGVQTYTVKKGDTLGSISRKFFGTTKHWKKIASMNGISNPANLKVGKVIKIPGSPGKATTKRRRPRPAAVAELPSTYSPPPLSLPAPAGTDTILYQDKGLPKIILPETGRKDDSSRNMVNMEGLTGLTKTIAAYPLGKEVFSTSFGVIWNKITKRNGNRLKNGEDGDYYQFPVAITYAGENFEVGMQLPFESYDVFAPLTYNFRDGSDSGMGDASLRLKFSSLNENMASCLGIGAIFPTNDRKIGNSTSDNAWEVFGGVSTRRKEGGNLHVNAGYQAGSGNTNHEGVFANVGFDYMANASFNFMGEINAYNRVNEGRTTDLTLGMRYYVKPGMTFTLSAPISLQNDMFFGYDYRLQGQLQYHY